MKRFFRKFQIKRSEGGWLFGLKFSLEELFNRKKDKQIKELPKEPNRASPQFKMWLDSKTIKFKLETKKIADRILGSKYRYEIVSKHTGVPWEIIGVIHNMEASGSFQKHLHNGDDVKYPTKRYPPNRPKGWLSIPMTDRTWERSAIDALKFDKLDKIEVWSVTTKLDTLERYNGLGYRKYHKDVPTPYLWSGTQYYIKGKYVADGKWDANAVSKQVGAVPILKALGYGQKEESRFS